LLNLFGRYTTGKAEWLRRDEEKVNKKASTYMLASITSDRASFSHQRWQALSSRRAKRGTFFLLRQIHSFAFSFLDFPFFLLPRFLDRD